MTDHPSPADAPELRQQEDKDFGLLVRRGARNRERAA
jgi:hypothetical protein